jgi:hypothetical protein
VLKFAEVAYQPPRVVDVADIRSSWLPAALAPRGSAHQLQNLYFINGANTPHDAGLLASAQLSLTLAKAFKEIWETVPRAVRQVLSPEQLRVHLLLSRTANLFGMCRLLADLAEGGNDRIWPASPRETVENPATISVCALILKASEDFAPLLLVAHSQGTMVTANAILALAGRGSDDVKGYMRSRVRVLDLCPIIEEDVRLEVTRAVAGYLPYWVSGDPLALLLAGETGANRTSWLAGWYKDVTTYQPPDAVTRISNRFDDALRAATGAIDLSIGAWEDSALYGHALQNYLGALYVDIVEDLSRDPRHVVNAYSTGNPAAVRVRDFLLALPG